MHPDLVLADQLAFLSNELIITDFSREKESEEYGASDFKINDRRIKFRIGKITPTKIGQFTTLWKRIGKGPIIPFDVNDEIDLFIVSVRHGDRLGQFVFPKKILCQKGIISKEGKGGKRAVRIYPPWDFADNRQAKNTQIWQLLYFFEISPNIDIKRMKILYSVHD
jgi:hypothetical protein